ncbi:MAG: aldolase/citrate lyase family protein [Pseudomonadota bacterium]
MKQTLTVFAALLGALCANYSAADEHFAATPLIELWAAGAPAFGLYVRPEESAAEDDSDSAVPFYSRETGEKLAANPYLDFAFLSLESHYDANSARRVSEGMFGGDGDSSKSLLVRIPPISVDGIEAARVRAREVLSLGAHGVVIPHVLSADEAREAISFFEDVDVWSPENPDGSVIVMLIVEDPDVFAELDEIAAMPGFSSLVCGIGSLTSALGGDREAAEKINQQVLAVSKRRGKPNLTTVDLDSVALRVEQGFLGLLAYGPDGDDVLRRGRAAAGRTP